MSNNLNYTQLVEKSEFPRQAEVPLDDFFNDARGEITNLLLTPITSVARITSKSGSVRANHYHKTDWHYAFVESGQILYFEREIGSLELPEPAIFKPGQMFFTRPNVEHAMLFPVDSVFYTFAKNIRSHDNHESDLERVSFITPEVIARYIP
jgi:quercetin dioxygenase-like cupin family protein